MQLAAAQVHASCRLVCICLLMGNTSLARAARHRHYFIGSACRQACFQHQLLCSLCRYWYPLSYCVSLAVQPTALIGVDASLRAPKDYQASAACRFAHCCMCICPFACLHVHQLPLDLV